MSLARFLLTLKARWATAALVLATVLALTALVSTLLPKQYTATSMVLVDIKSADPLAVSPQQQAGQAAAYMATQVDLLQSERVARAVMAATGMTRDPNDAAHQLWRSKTNGLGEFEEWQAARMKKKLEVRPTKESGVISIAYTADSREAAAQIANAYVQAYVDTSLALRVEPARTSTAFFDERATQLRTTLDAAQAKLSEFQRQHGLLTIGGAEERLDVETARLNELSSQLVALQAQTGESGSRQSQARANPEKSPEVINHPVVSTLSAEVLRQETRLNEMSARLGDRHPSIVEQRAAVAQLRSQLASESRRVAASLGVNDTVNQQRLGQVRTALEAQRTKVLDLTTRRDEARVLQKDVQNAQTAFDAVTGRSTQSATESQARMSNVSVLKTAAPPALASSPQMEVNLGVAALLGSVLALAVVLVQEQRNRRLRCADDVPELLDLPLLVEIPARQLAGKGKALSLPRLGRNAPKPGASTGRLPA
jgi:polysaccharide biosynthesis transport protein